MMAAMARERARRNSSLVNFRLADDLRNLLKAEAAVLGRSMTDIVESLLAEHYGVVLTPDHRVMRVDGSPTQDDRAA